MLIDVDKAFASTSKDDLLSKLKLNKKEKEYVKERIATARHDFSERFVGDIDASTAIRNLSTTDTFKYFLPSSAKQRFLQDLTQREKYHIAHSPAWILRKDQLLDFPNPTVIYMAGRGSGKSFAAINTLIAKHWIQGEKSSAIVGRTASEAKKYIADLVIRFAPDCFKPRWTSGNRLLWPNGTITYVFSAEKPDSIRGANIGFAICDELSSWRYPDSYAQLKFTMRDGVSPQVVITTTPKNNDLTKELLKEENAILKSGASFNNRRLPLSFFTNLIAKYPPGTNLYRQELLAELVDDNLDALFTQVDIDNSRIRTKRRFLNVETGEYEIQVTPLPQFKKIIVAVDPAVTDKDTSDESGIVVWGIDFNNKHYIVYSEKLRVKPYELITRAIKVYRKFRGNVLIVETNQGGDTWQQITAQLDTDRVVKFKGYHSKVSKLDRLQISSALMLHKVLHFIDEHASLEQEITNYDGKGASPNLLDAMAIAGIEATLDMSSLEQFVAIAMQKQEEKKELAKENLEITDSGILIPKTTRILTAKERRELALKEAREKSSPYLEID